MTTVPALKRGEYRFSGPQGRGALRRLRETKRLQAEERNALTLPERRSTKHLFRAGA